MGIMFNWLKETFVNPFRSGEIEDGVFAFVIFAVVFTMLLVVGKLVLSDYRFEHSPSIRQKSKLLYIAYNESTASTSVVPFISTNMVGGVGIVSHGRPESYVTIWDCGEYGRLKTENYKVFQYAKPESLLVLKGTGNDLRIVDIIVE